MQILRETRMEAWEKARKLGPEEVLGILERKRLDGRGGAAYPTAKKWRLARAAPGAEKFIVCNADEGEPGTFKDKFIIRNNAATMVEGMLIAAYAVGAKKCFIYLRGEYEEMRKGLEKQVKEVLKKAKSGIEVEIVRGAGAYICGEQTAILQSIMGFRGCPTYRPPHPTEHGLWGMPTVVNNVETLTCAAQALLYDDWNPDLRLFSISGNVRNPGVYELPIGVKMSTLIDLARPKRKLKAMSFGCFGGIMPIDENMKLTPETIGMERCQHGAYSVILVDDANNVVDVSYSIAKFYTYESCGKCTPCREGTIRVLNLLKKVRAGEASKEDLETLRELAEHIQETSLCGLGQTAGNHVLTSLQHFPEDYAEFMKAKAGRK